MTAQLTLLIVPYFAQKLNSMEIGIEGNNPLLLPMMMPIRTYSQSFKLAASKIYSMVLEP